MGRYLLIQAKWCAWRLPAIYLVKKKVSAFIAPSWIFAEGLVAANTSAVPPLFKSVWRHSGGGWQLYVFFFNTDLTSLNQPVVWCLKIGLFILILKNVWTQQARLGFINNIGFQWFYSLNKISVFFISFFKPRHSPSLLPQWHLALIHFKLDVLGPDMYCT